ncbi:hypothetical protein ACU5DF_01025 [Aliivibrio wodanis]|uniref:Membrane protein n=1 Tax=Aliivibrio wodanis TaxID=80852 RepID=A0A090I6P6_9GAMM|nr:membrane protein [Aliivibrio wodanis]
MTRRRVVSKFWIFVSFLTFIGVELLIGGFVGKLIVGRYISISLQFMLQGLLHLSAFFIGGIIIGLISPGKRMFEPAFAAFLSVLVVLSLSLFTPYSYIGFSMDKMMIGGVVAFLLALLGSYFGERFSGN